MMFAGRQSQGGGAREPRIHRVADSENGAGVTGATFPELEPSLEGIEPGYAQSNAVDGQVAACKARIRTPGNVVGTRSGPIGRLVSQAGRFRDSTETAWAAPLRPCYLDRKRGLLFIASPLDAALPDLRGVLDTKWVRRTLEATDILAEHSGRMRGKQSTLTLMSYRPGRRAVVRLDARFNGKPTRRVLFLRLHADAALAEASERALKALAWVGDPVPSHLGRPLPHLSVESRCAGEPLNGQALCRPELGRNAGRLLARIHSSTVPSEMKSREDAEVVESGLACAARLAECHSDLGARAQRVLFGLPALCPDAVTPRLLHGDVYPAQFIAERERVALVDWDLSHAGHPAWDLGRLRARLALEVGTYGLLAFSEILSGYSEVARPPSPEALRWHEAHALLRLVDTHFRSLGEGWVAHTQRIIDRLELIA